MVQGSGHAGWAIQDRWACIARRGQGIWSHFSKVSGTGPETCSFSVCFQARFSLQRFLRFLFDSQLLSCFLCFFLSFSALSAAYFKSLISAVESKYIFMAGWLDGEGDGYGGRRRVLALGLGSGLVGRKGWEA